MQRAPLVDAPVKAFGQLHAEQERNLHYLRGSEPGLASEIASIVDMPGATVRSHLRRGLKALRKELEP